MKERPILFSAPMVRAILAGTKTQTRRLVTKSTSVVGSSTWEALDWTVPTFSERASDVPDGGPAPYDRILIDGKVPHIFMPAPRTQYLHVPALDHETRHRVYPRVRAGDRLWVKETWRADSWDDAGNTTVRYRADDSTQRLVAPDPDAWIEKCCDAAKRGGWEEIGGEMCGTEERPFLPWRPSIFLERWASRLTLAVESVRVERLQDISEADALAEGCTAFVISPHGAALTADSGSARDDYAHLWNAINGKRAPWDSNPWVWVVTFARATA